ncbi:MAG: hypothetical protein LBU39_08385 [Desulfobulbaceae bacterium]|jgi:hypothetical protein|nr:hypothetical protein [Desulfobulbaceae bacterium]
MEAILVPIAEFILLISLIFGILFMIYSYDSEPLSFNKIFGNTHNVAKTLLDRLQQDTTRYCRYESFSQYRKNKDVEQSWMKFKEQFDNDLKKIRLPTGAGTIKISNHTKDAFNKHKEALERYDEARRDEECKQRLEVIGNAIKRYDELAKNYLKEHKELAENQQATMIELSKYFYSAKKTKMICLTCLLGLCFIALHYLLVFLTTWAVKA